MLLISNYKAADFCCKKCCILIYRANDQKTTKSVAFSFFSEIIVLFLIQLFSPSILSNSDFLFMKFVVLKYEL